MFRDTITIFNRYENELYEDIYYKTILHGVCVQNYETSEENVQDASVNNKCKVFMHSNSLDKPYLTPKEWLNLTSDTLSQSFTLMQGDYIVVGEVNEDITNISSLYEKYDYVYKIRTVAKFDILNSIQVIAV